MKWYALLLRKVIAVCWYSARRMWHEADEAAGSLHGHVTDPPRPR